MTPDEELQRLSRTCIDPGDRFAREKQVRALKRAERAVPVKPCFVLKREIEARYQVVPRFALNRGEAISLPLWGNSIDTCFIQALEKNRDWATGRWISLIPQPRGLFGRLERRSTWLSRVFGFSKRRGRKYLSRAGLADTNYEIPNDRLVSRLLLLDLAHQYKFDLIIPHLGGLDPITALRYCDRIRDYQADHAWIFRLGGYALITRTLLLENRQAQLTR